MILVFASMVVWLRIKVQCCFHTQTTEGDKYQIDTFGSQLKHKSYILDKREQRNECALDFEWRGPGCGCDTSHTKEIFFCKVILPDTQANMKCRMQCPSNHRQLLCIVVPKSQNDLMCVSYWTWTLTCKLTLTWP